MSAEKKLSAEELKKLCYEIIEEMTRIWSDNDENTQKGLIRQKAVINKINAHPEVLRVQDRDWAYETIGIAAVFKGLFYVTIRTLEDAEACEQRDRCGLNVYDYIKQHEHFRDRIVNSWQYERLVERLEARLAGKEEHQYDDEDIFDECEDMDQYDSIVE